MVKCLGVWIDDGLTWKRQVEAVRKNCFCRHAKLRANGKKVHCALVLPHCSQECAKLAWMAKERYSLPLPLSKKQLDKFCSVIDLFILLNSNFSTLCVTLVCHAGLWLPCRSGVQADGKFSVEN